MYKRGKSMTISEIHLLPPLAPTPGMSKAGRTIRAGAGVAIRATDVAVEVAWQGRVYSYPRQFVVCVSVGQAEKQAGPSARRAALKRCPDCEGALLGDELTRFQLDWPGVQVRNCACGAPALPDGTNVSQSGPKPEEPLPTKAPRKRRSKRGRS